MTEKCRQDIIFTEQKRHILDAVLNAMYSKNVVLGIKNSLQSILKELYTMDAGNIALNSKTIFSFHILDPFLWSYLCI